MALTPTLSRRERVQIGKMCEGEARAPPDRIMAKLNTRGNRRTSTGNRIVRRGLPKKKGGIGLNITGITRRKVKMNMQRRKIRFSDGTVRRMWVRVKDLKAGMYDNPDPKDFARSASKA